MTVEGRRVPVATLEDPIHDCPGILSITGRIVLYRALGPPPDTLLMMFPESKVPTGPFLGQLAIIAECTRTNLFHERFESRHPKTINHGHERIPKSGNEFERWGTDLGACSMCAAVQVHLDGAEIIGVDQFVEECRL